MEEHVTNASNARRRMGDMILSVNAQLRVLMSCLFPLKHLKLLVALNSNRHVYIRGIFGLANSPL